MPDPIAVPRQPRFTPPPRACDAHCHVFGEGPRAAFSSPRQLLALHRRLGIERCVIVQGSPHASSAAAMLEAIRLSDGRYRGVALVGDDATAADLRALHDQGVRGVRFTFVAHLGGAPDLDMMRRVIDRIAPLGWHVTLLIDGADLIRFADPIRAIPVPVAIDHMGRAKAAEGVMQPPFQLLLELVGSADFWVKVSAPERISAAGAPYYDAVPYAQALIAAAPDRVLWGTDWPHLNLAQVPDDGDLIDLVPIVAPDPALRRKLLIDNPARLYGFPP